MDFQPIFMAGLSLRRLDRSQWSAIRKMVVPAASPACAVCGFIAATKRSLIHADEVWAFPSPKLVILSDVRPLCVECHDAKDYADLLRRIMTGKASPSRSPSVIRHYCETNGCSLDDFDTDYRAALLRKQEIEQRYGWNIGRDVVVDFGRWDRPAERPRLSQAERAFVRTMYNDGYGPLVVGGQTLRTFGAAVRYIQALRLEDRPQLFDDLRGISKG